MKQLTWPPPKSVYHLIVILVIVWAAVCLTSCDSLKPEKTVQTSNPGLQIEWVATAADGCTIFRFYASSDWHYYVRCPQPKTTTSTVKQRDDGDGGTTTKTETIELMQ